VQRLLENVQVVREPGVKRQDDINIFAEEKIGEKWQKFGKIWRF
jgi:hypothetical protein